MLRTFAIGLGVFGILAIAALLLLRSYGVAQFDRLMNRVEPDPTAPVPTAEEAAFHRSLFVADLHADTLKWDRDLLERSSYGHVDLPLLVEGNVALQVFTIVTRSPIPGLREGDLGARCVSGTSLNVTAILSALQGRPIWNTRERAFGQIDRLKDAVRRSRERPGPELRLIETAEDLRRLVADRRAGQPVVGALLGIEGGHWIGDPDLGAVTVEDDMRQLFERGIRVFAPTHRFDNSLSGASEGCERYGLTVAGRSALQLAQQLGMAVDLAHISPRGLREAADLLAKPFMISHTGIKARCEPPCRPVRNLSDEEIALVLDQGGLIGVGFWPQAIGSSIWRIADVMQHIMTMADAVGAERGRNIALGADYDGSVTVPFDTSQLAILTAIMRRSGFDERTIRNIAGLNACRLFAEVLPGGSAAAAQETCLEPERDVLLREP
ncbi:dipeptidase [Microvirga roseola]|uniref:dipeptidase n=1 Tax=Microvirga roseola TaxID=2883126 RepID=UPI001E3AD070|nr:membrane dipeptidase [Microvirga roseola]